MSKSILILKPGISFRINPAEAKIYANSTKTNINLVLTAFKFTSANGYSIYKLFAKGDFDRWSDQEFKDYIRREQVADLLFCATNHIQYCKIDETTSLWQPFLTWT